MEKALLFVSDSLFRGQSPILSVPVMKSELKYVVLAPWVKLREAAMKAPANGQDPQEGVVLMGGSVFLTLLPL